MKKLLLIYNPVSGMTKTRLSLAKAIEFYDSRDYLVTVCLVNRLEDYAKDIDFKSYDLLVCSGGDGTLNITVSFLIRKNLPVQIAYIPSGSTNDFAYSLGSPKPAATRRPQRSLSPARAAGRFPRSTPKIPYV